MYFIFEQLKIDRHRINADLKKEEDFLRQCQLELINKFIADGCFIDNKFNEEVVRYQSEDGNEVTSYRLGKFKNLESIEKFVKESAQSHRQVKSQFVNVLKVTGQTNILDSQGNIVKQTSNCQTGECARFDDGRCREFGQGGCHDIAGFDPKTLPGPKQHHIDLKDFRKLLIQNARSMKQN